jgi:hypothetical protein
MKWTREQETIRGYFSSTRNFEIAATASTCESASINVSVTNEAEANAIAVVGKRTIESTNKGVRRS